jgi:hypothetical protein
MRRDLSTFSFAPELIATDLEIAFLCNERSERSILLRNPTAIRS